MDSIRFRDKELFKDIKSCAIKEGYKTMEEYVKMLHLNRVIYYEETYGKKRLEKKKRS